MAPSAISAAPPPPGTLSQRSSANPTFCGGSSGRDGMSSGRSPAISERSATRADLFDDRTAENVAPASTSVPPAVASEEMVTQSAKRPSLSPGLEPSELGEAAVRKRHRHGPLADGTGDALRRPVAHVTGGEQTGPARLEREGITRERPAVRAVSP